MEALNPERVIKVTPKKTGTSLLQVTDSKGNLDEVQIIVGNVPDGTNPDPGNGGETDLNNLPPELQQFIINFNINNFTLDKYLKDFNNNFLQYLSLVIILDESNNNNQMFETTSLLEDYNEIRYNNAWEHYGDKFTQWLIFYRPDLKNKEHEISNIVKTTFKEGYYNKYKNDHPDSNNYRIIDIENDYSPKINALYALNRKLFLASRSVNLEVLTWERNAYIYTLKKIDYEYWNSNPKELEQKIIDTGVDFSDNLGLKNAGQAWGAIASTAVAKINDDPYLEAKAKQELINELQDLTKEYSTIEGILLKKIKFISRLVKFNKKVTIKWYKPIRGGKTIDGIHYSEHSLARMAPKGRQYVDHNGIVIDGRGIPPTVVKNALKNGKGVKGTELDTIEITFDNIFLVVSTDKKRIITIIKKSNG